MTTAVGRTIVLVTLLLCLPLSATGGALAAPGPADGPSSAGALTVQTSVADGDNETVRHRNPDEYDGDGDDAAVERWLSDWLSDRLGDSARELSEGEYDLASEYVGDEYRDRLGQYVEVAGDGADEDEPSAYEEAQREQQRLAEAIAEYDETKAEYEAAREAGDDQRARELARELEALAAEIGDASQRIQAHFETISEDAEIDLTEASTGIESSNESVQSDQETVREAEFVETDLTVRAASEEISYTEPLVGEGELRTADGDPIADEEIRLAVGNQELRVETDADGAFEFEYRPISVPADADTVTVDYLPASDSVYLGDETDVPVSIEQVDAALSVSAVEPASVAYGDDLALETVLSVDGEPVAASVPLAVSIDDVPTGTHSSGPGDGNASAPDGSQSTLADGVVVPAEVPAGERELSVEPAFTDRALASSAATTTVTVTETEPDLDLETTRVGDDEVAVAGSLSVDDEGIAGAAIQIRADGTTLETLSTNEEGVFEGTVALADGDAVGDVSVAAVHDDEGTNLARAETATTVSFPGGDGGVPSWAWVAVGAIVLAGSAGGVYWYRSRGAADGTGVSGDRDEAGAPVASGSASAPAGTTATDPDPTVARPLLSRAADQLADGDVDGAVRSSYHAVRGSLETGLEESGTLTHWEFYRTYRDAGAGAGGGSGEESGDGSDGDGTDSLRDVTEGYERAAFGRDGVSDREAETVLERARELCGLAESGEAEPVESAPADD